MNNTNFRRITSTHSISNLSPNPDKPEPYRFEKLSCHSSFGNFFYHRLSEHRKKFSVFFTRNSTVNWLQLEDVVLNGYGVGQNSTIMKEPLHLRPGQELPIFPIPP